MKRPNRAWAWLAIAGALALAWVASTDRPDTDRTPPAPSVHRSASAIGLEAPAASPREGAGARAAVLDEPGDLDDATASAAHRALKPVAGDAVPTALESPIARALRTIEECQARYGEVRDYVCTFQKRERIDGRLTSPHVMLMKARTQPRSVYLKFRQPAAGREAIYIEGRHNGKVLAHDVGLGRLIAGTLRLDPKGPRAMEDCRHPITDAGIGPLLDTIELRWTNELDSDESRVTFLDDQRVDSRPCHRIDVTHTRRDPRFLFYSVHLFIDEQLGLPVRFEAYDWPSSPETPPDLVEEYTYADLKLNVGLGDIDFDVSNSAYAFGRF